MLPEHPSEREHLDTKCQGKKIRVAEGHCGVLRDTVLETHCGVTSQGPVAHVRAGTLRNNSRKKNKNQRIAVIAVKRNLCEYYP